MSVISPFRRIAAHPRSRAAPFGIIAAGRWDRRTPAQVLDLVGTDDGVFACVGFMACDAYCPKDLPLAAQLAYLPRKLTLAGIGRGGNGRRPTT